MKIYIVTADYCDEPVICGVALDEATAERIVACVKEQDGFKPYCLDIEEYDTDDYMPLNKGLYPFEVRCYEDGTVYIERTRISSFRHGFIREIGHNPKGFICQVYATDKDHAIEQGAKLIKEKLN